MALIIRWVSVKVTGELARVGSQIFKKAVFGMAECEKCKNESRICALEKDSERNSEQHREFYGKFSDIAVKLEVSDNTMQNMFSVLSEIKDDVKELKEKPARKWDSVSLYVITTLIGTILGYVVSIALK